MLLIVGVSLEHIASIASDASKGFLVVGSKASKLRSVRIEASGCRLTGVGVHKSIVSSSELGRWLVEGIVAETGTHKGSVCIAWIVLVGVGGLRLLAIQVAIGIGRRNR